MISFRPDGAGSGWILGEIKGWLKPPAAEKREGYLQCFADGSGISANSGNRANNLPNSLPQKYPQKTYRVRGIPHLCNQKETEKIVKAALGPG